jgi:hypothetical protein
MLELAAHFQIAGGKAKIVEWQRGEKATAFERFLREIYKVLPNQARPPSVETFVRISELLAATISEKRPFVMLPWGCLIRGLKDLEEPAARAEYILLTLKAYRPVADQKLIVV